MSRTFCQRASAWTAKQFALIRLRPIDCLIAPSSMPPTQHVTSMTHAHPQHVLRVRPRDRRSMVIGTTAMHDCLNTCGQASAGGLVQSEFDKGEAAPASAKTRTLSHSFSAFGRAQRVFSLRLALFQMSIIKIAAKQHNRSGSLVDLQCTHFHFDSDN